MKKPTYQEIWVKEHPEELDHTIQTLNKFTKTNLQRARRALRGLRKWYPRSDVSYTCRFYDGSEKMYGAWWTTQEYLRVLLLLVGEDFKAFDYGQPQENPILRFRQLKLDPRFIRVMDRAYQVEVGWKPMTWELRKKRWVQDWTTLSAALFNARVAAEVSVWSVEDIYERKMGQFPFEFYQLVWVYLWDLIPLQFAPVETWKAIKERGRKPLRDMAPRRLWEYCLMMEKREWQTRGWAPRKTFI